jgi:hypothetical protein
MTMNHLGYLLDWFELAASCPAEPFLEELSCSVGVMVSPKDAKVFLREEKVSGTNGTAAECKTSAGRAEVLLTRDQFFEILVVVW